MRWRLQKLDWPYAVGELIIVVAGVMIALGFDQWNSDRLERVEETEIIERFIADLRVDLDGISFGLGRVTDKEARLLRISSSLESPDDRPKASTLFLEDIVESATYGWNQARARRTTFDEVLPSGKFGLIRDTAIRVKIADYYDSEAASHDRIDERETGYSDLSYGLVPRVTEFEIEPDLSDAQLERIVDQVISSQLPERLVAEINFTRFVNERFTSWRSLCLVLIDELEFYRDTIE